MKRCENKKRECENKQKTARKRVEAEDIKKEKEKVTVFVE